MEAMWMLCSSPPLVEESDMEDVEDRIAASRVPGPIFLSHTGQDAAGRLLAPRIRKALDLNKRSVFFDEESISVGQKLAPAIFQAVPLYCARDTQLLQVQVAFA
jgi:hypothetical protein